ncbi:WSC domain-containing protein 2-like, partial [Pollicipes pollicipes]
MDHNSWLAKLNFTASHYGEPQFTWSDGQWPYIATSSYGSDSDPELLRAGFLGELQNIFAQNVIVTKTHDPPFPRVIPDPDQTINSIDFAAYPMDITARRAILIIRDPFKVILSSRHYQFSSSVHVENDPHPLEHFRGEDWQTFIEYYAQSWLEFNIQWLEQTDDLLVIHYENLQSEPWAQLERVHTFLGVSPDPGRMLCLRQH